MNLGHITEYSVVTRVSQFSSCNDHLPNFYPVTIHYDLITFTISFMN